MQCKTLQIGSQLSMNSNYINVEVIERTLLHMRWSVINILLKYSL